MGSNDLADASVSWRSDKGKGVTERLKGLFGSKKKAQDMTTLDDVRFSQPSHLPETNSIADEVMNQRVEPVRFEPYRAHLRLDDFVDLQEEDDDIVEIIEIETEVPSFVRIETETVVEVHEMMSETDEVDYCDFLPPMCRGERRPVGSRSNGHVRSPLPMTDHVVYDADEPVSGFNAEPFSAVEKAAVTAVEEIRISEVSYVPNFVLVDEDRASDVIILPAPRSEPEIALEEMLPEDAVRAFEQEDSDVPFDLDIRIYDDEEIVAAVPAAAADHSVSEQTSGISFDFFSPAASQNSGVSFMWGITEKKDASAEIIEEIPLQSSRLDGMFI